MKMFGVPADKEGEGITDESTHLTAYKIARTKGSRRHERVNKTVENRFGQIAVQVRKPILLLVPAAKSLTDPVDPPDPTAHSLDHYKCYKVKPLEKFVRFQVTIEDQFTTPTKRLRVEKPTMLCAAADKNGEGIKNP